jgi:hypothetical protein
MKLLLVDQLFEKKLVWIITKQITSWFLSYLPYMWWIGGISNVEHMSAMK